MGSIVCFGDSNTWGLWPEGGGRYDKDTRWPGIVAKRFSDTFQIVEEGLNGRTANEIDEEEPYLNGRNYAEACVLSHRPIDILIVMLGNNDIKERYNKTAERIADSITELVAYMEGVLKEKQPEDFKVILVSPKGIDERVLGDEFNKDSIEKSHMLGGLLKARAKAHGWEFIDADIPDVILSCDGLHLAATGHKALAEHIIHKIEEIMR